MNHVLNAVAQAKREGDPSLLNAAIPYARFMGISIATADDSPDSSADELLGAMRFSDMLIGNPRGPNLHGGAIGALLESTAIFQLLWSTETTVLPKIINITIHYLRTGRAQDTFARGTITKHGRRVAAVRVEAWQEDPTQPIAVAYAHFLIRPESG